MRAYLYRWNLRLDANLRVEVEVAASSAVVARRTVHEVLRDRNGVGWVVESVSRTSRPAAVSPFVQTRIEGPVPGQSGTRTWR
jgi:hypothetical protein